MGEGWFNLPDEAFSSFLGDFAYRIDGEMVVEGGELSLDLFSGDYTHTIFWDERFWEENPDPLMMLQVYSGVPGSAVLLGEISLSDNSPEDIYLADIIQEEGEYFFVVFQKELATTYVISEDDIPQNSNGDMIMPLGTVIDIGDIPIAENGPTPDEINEHGHLWYQRYFETHALLWCGSENDDTSSVPLTPWDMVSFSVFPSLETTPPMLSYATSTVYEGDGIFPDKGVAGEDELTFAIVYTDAENDAPEYVRAWVRDDEGADMFLDMAPASESEAGAAARTTLTDGVYANGELFTVTSTFSKGVYQYTFLTAEEGESGEVGEEQSFPVSIPGDSELTFQTGYSSVAFLPGVMASRLYVGSNRVWEPGHDSEARQLFLDVNGNSIEGGVYVEEGEVVDEEVGVAGNIYKTWLKDLEEWKEDGFIADYVPLAYDWRLSFDDILSSGIQIDDRIYYGMLHTTETPYIYEELKRLADESDSGKVTIVAHSMGGLLLKKALYDLEENTNHPYRFLLEDKRIEDVILVASPQWGTPEAVPALLHGERLDKSALGYSFMKQDTGRELAWTMPSAHALLPSEAYMEHVTDVDEQGNTTEETKVVRFNQSLEDIHDPYIVYDTIVDFFGDAITTYDNLLAFLGGDENRPMPEIDDVVHPIKLFNSMTSYGETLHSEIDDWSAPDMDADGNPDIRVVQIAGWGIPDTIAGYEYYARKKPVIMCYGHECVVTGYEEVLDYIPKFTYEGDKTVVLPSAVAMDTETYYVNLDEYNKGLKRNREHSSILETSSVRDTILNVIQGVSDVVNGLRHIATDTSEFEWNKNGTYIRLAMHSPVNVHVYDSEGNHVGVTEEGNIDELIPNSYYTTFGESAYLGMPGGEEYTVVLEGTADGTFTFEMVEEGNGTTIETVYTDVFVKQGAIATTTIETISDVPELVFDTNADGEPDAIVFDDMTKESVSYDTLRDAFDTLPKQTKKMLKKQVTTAEKLHNRGNVIAAKATVKLIEKEVQRLDCAQAKREWQKKRCIESDDVVRINAIISVLLEQLEAPVQERKEEIKDKTEKLRDKIKNWFSR